MDDWKLQPARDLDLPIRARWRSARRESGLIEALAQSAWWPLVRAYLAVAHRLTIDGREHLPASPPFILVANHASHLDAICLAAALPFRIRVRVFPVAAGDTFFETPALSAFAALCLNAIPLWRRNCGAHDLLDLRARLVDEPCGYILFPEGTRSRTGEMAAFKPGLGMLVAAAPVPVIPCRIRGAFDAFPPSRRMPAWKPIRIHCGPPLNFAHVANDRAGWCSVASQVESRVRAL
jgi:1-acyl-sn-glycerol-3-phosphate acyltransferase